MKALPLIILCAEAVISDTLNDYRQSNLLFTTDFYQTLLSAVKYNFLFSPASIQAALAVVAFGASGKTGMELNDAIHFPFGLIGIKEMYQRLLKKSSPAQSKILNYFDIYIDNATLFKSYDILLREVFKAHIVAMPFPTKPYMPTGSVVVLSNGMVVQHQLTLSATMESPFRKAYPLKFFMPNNAVETIINMVHVQQKCNYYYNVVLQAEFVEIPFTDNETTLTIVLPDSIENLSNVEKYLCQVLSPQPYQTMDISVTIPRIWDQYEKNIIIPLRSLGITEAFSNRAEFPSFSESSSRIIKITHEAFLNLDEEIDESATLSGSPILSLQFGLPDNPAVKFVANHPFLYYVKHSVLGVAVIGRYVKPHDTYTFLS